MKSYFKDDRYTKNFILLGSQIDEMKSKAKTIVSEAKKKNEEIFNGEVTCFPFDLRYVPPFDKNFGELMRLQGVAAEHVRFKDGYKGYILINVSEFIKHEREPYFIRSLKFLHDENENWRYVFMVDKENEKAAREMTQVILEIIKFTKVIDNEVASDNNRKFLKKICDEANLKFESDAFEFIESLLTNEKLSRNVVETIVCDLSAVCEHSAVSLREIKEYFDNESTVIRYMLTQNHYERILMLCNDLMKKGREDE